MNEELAEHLINYSLTTGADFSEIFYENFQNRSITFLNNKIDKVNTSYAEGVGIRLALKDNILYADTNTITKENLTKIITKLKDNFNSKPKLENVVLKSAGKKRQYTDMTDKDKKEFLETINKIAREYDKRVIEVKIVFDILKKEIIIANSLGKYITEDRNYTGVRISITVSENDKVEKSSEMYRFFDDTSFIKKIDLETEIKKIVDSAINKLKAVYIKGGKMPVILESGFGAVIFHEACGHAMEATAVAKNLSVLNGKLGKKIASKKVTIIDDGTIPNLWGTTTYDDEGNKTRKNILIKNGILKSYLVDYLNDRQMKHGLTGSSRRQNFRFAPTSRMNNTYLAPGTDKIADMFKNIKYGLYAKKLGGGSVDTATGDFNFLVEEGYLIKNGKIATPVKMASLIGNTLEILSNVEMVSDDLKYSSGGCGSESGWVPVTIGQPTVKISSILVGGASND
ncbi:MAG TPA: TldD/PmbA family protein [Bacilli bacterium]|nr:TldD/PmbA family protein [Bacilli bacterium]